MNKRDAVYIEWLDSCTTYGWQNKDQDGLSRIRSVGMLVRETRTHLTISTSTSEGGRHVDMISIPKRVITKRKKVRY